MMKPYDQACREAEDIFFRYGNMLYRIAVVMLGSSHDAEDVVQDTLIRYMEHGKPFRDKNHEKAWLVRVTVNLCKNRLLFARRHPQVEYSELAEYGQDQKDSCLMECLMKLPWTYRAVLLLHYIMGYSVRETAQFLRITEAAAKKRLERGRKRFREIMEQEGAAEHDR